MKKLFFLDMNSFSPTVRVKTLKPAKNVNVFIHIRSDVRKFSLMCILKLKSE